jgi:hypothetical protein
LRVEESFARSGELQLHRANARGSAERRLPGDQDRHGPASSGKSRASRNLLRLHQHEARLGRPEAKPATSVLDQLDELAAGPTAAIWREVIARDHSWNYTIKHQDVSEGLETKRGLKRC